MTRARWLQAVIGVVIAASAIGCGGGALPGAQGGQAGSGGSGGSTGEAGTTGSGGSGVMSTTCTLAPGAGSFPTGGAGGTGGGGRFDVRGCPCSRRSGENNSWMCPPGTGKVVIAEIGPEGGTVLLDGTPATKGVPLKLEIPYNALTQTVTIQVAELTAPPPQPYVDYSPVYELQPAGLTFATPPRLMIPFQNVQGIIPPEVAGYVSTDDCASFTRIGDSYINAGFIVASLSRLGQVFAGYPRNSADDLACAGGTGAAGSGAN